MIDIKGLSKIYNGERVVDGADMQLETGTITVIVGTSGSGKSTLLRMINRLIDADEGTVHIDGQDTRDMGLDALRRRIGYVIQDHGLFPHWTVARNVATVPKLLGWPAPDIKARVHEMLETFQLDPDRYGPRFPHELSGGQAQRVGVARALAARPDMLLMDEPFGALDPVIRAQAQDELRTVQKQFGATVLMVTHDMAEALSLGDKIAVMDAGKIVQIGPPEEIVTRPADPFVRSLIAATDRPFRRLALIGLQDHIVSGTAQGPAIAPDASLADALSQMIWSGRDALPVANAQSAPDATAHKIITLRDVLRLGQAQ